jgi:hypothetical protein
MITLIAIILVTIAATVCALLPTHHVLVTRAVTAADLRARTETLNECGADIRRITQEHFGDWDDERDGTGPLPAEVAALAIPMSTDGTR